MEQVDRFQTFSSCIVKLELLILDDGHYVDIEVVSQLTQVNPHDMYEKCSDIIKLVTSTVSP